MHVLDYTQAAAATAMPAAYDRAYLVPMIVGEVGELFGQRAKAVWHGWTPERLQQELVSEFGDVCWGTAILMELEGTDHSKVEFSQHVSQPRNVYGLTTTDPWLQLQQRATDLYLYYADPAAHTWLRGGAQQMWLALQTHCQAITGVPFDDVLQHNLAKLAGRVERGTLVGQGDHR